MKNYVGRKIKGFRFENRTDNVLWFDEMQDVIAEIGKIVEHEDKWVYVEFKDNSFCYPSTLIESHLIEECTCENTGDNTCNYCEELQDKAILQDAKSKMQTPEIPQLGEGILMEVSDDGVDWGEANIIAKLSNGRYLSTYVNTWKHARPIPQLPKYTHAELVEKLGEDFIYEK